MDMHTATFNANPSTAGFAEFKEQLVAAIAEAMASHRPGAAPDVMTDEQATEYLGLKPRTLATWRARGEGPPVVKKGTWIRYRKASLDEWLEGLED